MTRSTFDEVTLKMINESLESIISKISNYADVHKMPVTRSDIRKLIEVANKIAIENEG